MNLHLLLLAFSGGLRRDLPVEESWDPGEAEVVQLELIEAFLDAGEWDRALVAIIAVREQGTTGPALDVLQARALVGKGLTDDALKILGTGPSMDPQRHHVRCVAYMDLGQVEQAELECRRALRHTPRKATASVRADRYNNHGFTLAAAGRHEEAVEAYREALALDPSMEVARNNLAFSLAALGRDDEAYTQFMAALAPRYGFDPGVHEANAWLNLGLAQQGRGDVDAARASYTQALELEPQHVRARDALQSLDQEE